LHFVKHTLRRWIEQAEQEMNLKLFGRESEMSIRFNADSLLSGDLKTRMEAHATAIQNGIKTPNEVRDLEELEPRQNDDDLLIQGATMQIESQPNVDQDEIGRET
jgi:HK97 family phage portal protein